MYLLFIYVFIDVMRLECPVWIKCIFIVIFIIITQAWQETRLINMRTGMRWRFHKYLTRQK